MTATPPTTAPEIAPMGGEFAVAIEGGVGVIVGDDDDAVSDGADIDVDGESTASSYLYSEYVRY